MWVIERRNDDLGRPQTKYTSTQVIKFFGVLPAFYRYLVYFECVENLIRTILISGVMMANTSDGASLEDVLQINSVLEILNPPSSCLKPPLHRPFHIFCTDPWKAVCSAKAKVQMLDPKKVVQESLTSLNQVDRLKVESNLKRLNLKDYDKFSSAFMSYFQVLDQRIEKEFEDIDLKKYSTSLLNEILAYIKDHSTV